MISPELRRDRLVETTQAEHSDLLTPVELSTRWGCSRGHLANLRSAGAGPQYIKLGSAVRYRVTDVIAFEIAHIVTCS